MAVRFGSVRISVCEEEKQFSTVLTAEGHFRPQAVGAVGKSVFILSTTCFKSTGIEGSELIHRFHPVFGCPLQSAVMLREASQISLVAVSSLENCPSVLITLRSRALMLSMVLVG